METRLKFGAYELYVTPRYVDSSKLVPLINNSNDNNNNSKDDHNNNYRNNDDDNME